MEDRIQINGVWYVREQDNTTPKLIGEPIEYVGCVYETDKYCWEATRMYDDVTTNTFFTDAVDIKFTDKRVKPWKEESWDHTEWMRGVLKNNPESITYARESMCEEGIQDFKAFLLYLKGKQWL